MTSKIAVISGGTATNELVSLFLSLGGRVAYILPISDNGGSTSELIRVIGGPAIGDIRSRLTRLIPEDQQNLQKLLSFRLSSDPKVARAQWNEFVDGQHELWAPISGSTKEIIRAFFIHVNVELLKRSRLQATNSKKQFRYELANVGNLFLTGVRLFIGSLDSAVELFSKITGIDPEIEVLPCINTNFTYHISALLQNGLIITGQSQISHPSESNPRVDNYPPPISKTRPSTPENVHLTHYFGTPSIDGLTIDTPYNQVAIANSRRDSVGSIASDSEEEESGNIPQYTHPELKKSQLHFNKTEKVQPLLSPIKRIFYVSPYGQEICPTAHSKVVSTVSSADVIVYSIGSLMTSIVPIVILKGIGKAIANDINKGVPKKKILLLNGCQDRETFGMSAVDFVRVIVELAVYSIDRTKVMPDVNITIDVNDVDWSKYISHLIFMENPQIQVDEKYLHSRGIKPVMVKKVSDAEYYDLDDLKVQLNEIVNQH
ncbi:UPF0052-domain-containing protein [Suhomyces tanzawaensis NRRL Y-17324]|uniref:UPF0052-domain-containing protein n=1 Tax=Suhomyces tanzawaensis NRRL Y-17324 TaxID=984487 RepID=A0A1E4SRG4_9ASCO|nr:UPF0052-domain-containing protein [Suhomyces tanzawaensis NRRL Y-17324]ODV82099.1 UPF0052-domain-containing protein [Suhomyces tanzawaensis NRRL Y-17324]